MNQTQLFIQRISTLQKKISPHTLLLFCNQKQIEYFTGFNFLINSEREAFFVCSGQQAFLIYTSFSPIDNYECITYLPGIHPSELKRNLEKIIANTGAQKIYFDSNTLCVSEYKALETIELVELEAFTNNLATELMSIKDSYEIEKISQASKISNQVIQDTIQNMQVGMTEVEVAGYIYNKFEQAGITQLAFPTIVAFGANSAKPHHQPTDMKLEEDMPVLIDMGAKYQGYCSDMTRTVWFGPNPDKLFIEVETIVKNAYLQALSSIEKYFSSFNKNYSEQVKLTAKQIDSAARVYISNQGYGDNFIHTTGHGLGLEIHEQPSISWQNNMELVPNQTLTIEPGIYLEGNFGYRHENTILTTKSGVEVLTEL